MKVLTAYGGSAGSSDGCWRAPCPPPATDAAAAQAAGLPERDLLDLRYEGEAPHVLPYCLAVDEGRRCLVLAIRGGWVRDGGWGPGEGWGGAGLGAVRLQLGMALQLPEAAFLHLAHQSTPRRLCTALLLLLLLYPPHTGSLSLEDVVRDLLFEPASLDEWEAKKAQGDPGGGLSWHDPPPDVVPASESMPLPSPPALAEPRTLPAVRCSPCCPRQYPPATQPTGCSWRCIFITILCAAEATRHSAHSGILQAARATVLDLQRHGVLRDALLAPGGRCAGYRLVVTGHSLGAGCAFLVALYLRRFCPDLRRAPAVLPPGRGVGGRRNSL